MQNRPAGGSKIACEGPLGGFSVPVGPNLAAKAARKPSLGGSGGALGTLLALLGLSWGLFGRSWGVPGRSWAPLGGRFELSRGLIWTIWTMSVALREIQQKHRILPCFWPSRASQRVAPKSAREASWAARGESKMVSGRPPDGSFVPVGPNFAAKAARKPCLGGSGGALGALLACLGASWASPAASRAAPGRSWGWFWDLPGADLDVLDDVCGALLCFWASRASRRGLRSLQNWPGRPLRRLVGPTIGLEGPS